MRRSRICWKPISTNTCKWQFTVARHSNSEVWNLCCFLFSSVRRCLPAPKLSRMFINYLLNIFRYLPEISIFNNSKLLVNPHPPPRDFNNAQQCVGWTGSTWNQYPILFLRGGYRECLACPWCSAELPSSYCRTSLGHGLYYWFWSSTKRGTNHLGFSNV